MVRPLGLPFDPIERAGEIWEAALRAGVGDAGGDLVFRVQQILLARFDEVLKPHELTFARYEVLVLLHVQPHRPAAAQGHRQPADGAPDQRHQRDRPAGGGRVRRAPAQPARRPRGAGRHHRRRPARSSSAATEALTGHDFGLADLPEAELDDAVRVLKRVRLGAGDVATD